MAKKKPEKSLDELLEEALVKKDEQPYEVPGNWVWVRICDNFELCNKKIVPQNGKALPYIGLEHMVKGGRILSISTTEGVKSAKSVFRRNDILYGKLRPYLDKHTLAESDGVCSTDILVFRNKKHYIPVLLNLYLGLPHVVRSSVESSSGINLPRVSGKVVSNFPMPLPPLPEQKQIVKRLSSVLGKLKEARELIQKARDTFEERRAAILNKAFTGALTKKWREENPDIEPELSKIQEIEKKPFDIPAGWEWVYLEEVSELITKGSSPKWQGIKYTDDKSQVLFITSENVRDGYLELDKEKYLELKFNCKQKRSILKNGDVLLNIVGASIGRAAIFDVERVANINQAVSIIRLVDKRLNRYLNFYLNSAPAKRYYSESKVDVARANLSLKDVSNIPLPLPPFEEQEEIVRILKNLLHHENEAKALIDMEEQLDLIEKSILSKAFRGKLGTNDPNDEPAIELLKRSLKEKMNK